MRRVGSRVWREEDGEREEGGGVGVKNGHGCVCKMRGWISWG